MSLSPVLPFTTDRRVPEQRDLTPAQDQNDWDQIDWDLIDWVHPTVEDHRRSEFMQLNTDIAAGR